MKLRLTLSRVLTSAIRYKSVALICCLLSLLLVSCFTGVESTNKITLSRDDRRRSRPTAEESLLASISPDPLSRWQQGKKFLVADDKINILLESNPGTPALTEGDTLRFLSTRKKVAPDGSALLLLVLECDGARYSLSTGRSPELADSAFSSSQIPLLIDLDMVAHADRLLRDRTVWIRTPLWQDKDGNTIRRRKFVPVTVTAVLPGDKAFPMRVAFRDETGETAFVPMGFRNTGPDSRDFAALFFLSDNRRRYSEISDSNWQLIQQGRLATGMTKEECKLSIGNPSDVNSGHDYSRTLEIWQYDDGSFLRFADGLLVDFRK